MFTKNFLFKDFIKKKKNKVLIKHLKEIINNKNEIIKNRIKYFLFLRSDFIQFNFGPIVIANKKGIKRGTINL